MAGDTRFRLFVACAAALLVTATARAQSWESHSDVPDRFRVEAGGFRVGGDTELTFNTAGVFRPAVDFEDLNLPKDATRFYIEGFWRPWRRHQFSLSWFGLNRDGDPTTVQREFTWGDRVVTVGTTARARANSDYVSGVYRFAAFKNDRFEIGPSIGIGHLWLEAGIAGEVTGAGTGGGAASRSFDISRDLGQITGDLGGYFHWWAARRLLIRGDLRYIIVKPENAEASVTEGRAAALYHPWRNVGIGVQYNYTKFRYDRDILSTELGGHLRYRGGQVLLSAAF